MLDLPSQNSSISIYATWKSGKILEESVMQKGRYLIGSSSFANIRISHEHESICGTLDIDNDSIILKCIADLPTIYIGKKKLNVGETYFIGEDTSILLGTTKVSLKTITNQKELMQAKEIKVILDDHNDFTSQNINEIRQSLSQRLQSDLNLVNMDINQLEGEGLRIKANLKLAKILSVAKLPENFKFTKEELQVQVLDEVLGLGPLEPLLADESITEIMVNNKDQIYIEKSGKIELSEIGFTSEQTLINVIERIVSKVGRRIDTSSPIVDARLLDGSRVNAIIPPLALKGSCLTIRRFSKTPITVEKLVEFGSLNSEMANFLALLVESHKNIIISGGTGSGKTTLLNALSSFIPNNERIITVEDAAELQLQQEHVISLETRPPNIEGNGAITMRSLIKNTLRMRPDRIIVGECRGGEALDMLQAMNTGHDGSMTTAHANTPIDMLRRLETMTMMAGMELPLSAIREQVASAICFIVQQTRRKNGQRLVTDISWIKGLDRQSGEYVVVKLISRDKADNIVLHHKNLKCAWSEENLNSSYDCFFNIALENK